jgi:hypothetical protein
MADKPRFTLTLTLRDGYGEQQPLSLAIGCDEALRISSRAVDELKIGMGLIPMDHAVTMMRTKEMRRVIFKQAAQQLAGQMSDRMEDAEGWHDPERIEPARKQLGGRWQ